MTTHRGPETDRSLLWRRLALLAVSTLVGLLLLEGAVRVRQWMRYGRAAGVAYQLVTEPASGLRIPKPGLSTGRMHIDSRGFRSPELQVPKPKGRIRLAFMGASTTFCAEVSSDRATWPDLVCRQLQARYPGLSFDYINAGAPGFDVESSARNLATRVAPLEPDVVIYYEAANDFSVDTRLLARAKGLYSGKPEDPSWLARLSVAWFLVEKNLVVRQRERGPGPGRILRYDPAPLAQGFESRLIAFLQRAQRVAPVCAVATFSHKVRRDQPPEVQLHNCSTSLFYSPYMSVQGILDGWDAYNGAIGDAARQTGVILITGENDIPGDDRHFADSVHFTDAGSRAQADRMTQGLLGSPQFRGFLELREAELVGHATPGGE